jgi:hypothetical protein
MNYAICAIGIALSAGITHAQQDLSPTPMYDVSAGFVSTNDGTFNYQGYMEENGAPANGMYSFRFEAFNDAVGPGIASELHFFSPLIPVVDGLFSLDVQMGGDVAGGLEFWRTVGDQEMYLEIGVGAFQGGPYTTLGTRSKLGWSARAQYAGISESLRFPYTDLYVDLQGDPTTAISLTSRFGGTVFQAIAGQNQDEAIIDVQSATPYGVSFGSQTGGVNIDAQGRLIGMLSIADQFAVAGLIYNNSGLQSAAVLGQIANGVPDADAVRALNFNSGNLASLGTENYAGDFSGDVTVNGDIMRRYSGIEASAAPIAYGSIDTNGSISSGTSNFSCAWNPTFDRYEITIDGESFFFSSYTVVITPSGSSPRLVSTGSSSGNLLVYVVDPLGGYARIQNRFQFAVYKSDPNTVAINRNNTGMDDEEFYRLNGLTPEVVNIDDAVRPERERRGVNPER